MDLLGGYGSSASSSSSDRDEDEGKDDHKKDTAPLVAQKPGTMTNNNAAAAKTAAAAASATSNAAQRKQQQQQQRLRGKKILSLSAVLPTHIFNQLTKAQASRGGGGGGGTGGDDDDNDDDSYDSSSSEDDVHTRRKRPVSATADGGEGSNKKAASGRATAQDVGLSLFLSDLSSVAPTTKQQNPKSGLGRNDVRKEGGSPTTTAAKAKRQNNGREVLGAAFLSSTTTTTTIRKGGTSATSSPGTVRDIHGSLSNGYAHSPVQQRQQQGAEDDDDSSGHENQEGGTAASSAAPAVPVARRIPGFSAAPAVSSDRRRGDQARVSTLPPTYPGSSRGAPASARNVTTATADTTTTTAAPTAKKRSRKDMERALRHGQLDALNDTDMSTTTMEQANPDQYVPSEETYNAVPEHGIRVVRTAMYDPSTGTAVAGRGAARGKNQINQLLANAANLELERARTGAGGNAGSQLGKVHRANAKQKYGW